MSGNDEKKGLDQSNEDPFSDLLGDELGAWDDMFDSLHQESERKSDAGQGVDAGQVEATAVPDTDPKSEGKRARAFSESDELEITIGMPETVDEPLPEIGTPKTVSEAAFFAEPPLDSFSEEEDGMRRHEVFTSAGEEYPERETLSLAGGITDADLGLLSETPESFFDESSGIPIPRSNDVIVDDDFYDGIEIGSDVPTSTADQEELSVPSARVRGVAHLVRRKISDVEALEESGFAHKEITAIRENPLSVEDAFTTKTAVGPIQAVEHTLEIDDEEEVPTDSPSFNESETSEFSADLFLSAAQDEEVTHEIILAPNQELSTDKPVLPPSNDGTENLPKVVFSSSLPTLDLGSLVVEDCVPDTEDRSFEQKSFASTSNIELDLWEVTENPSLYEEAARVLESLGRWEEALTYWDQLLAFDPDSEVSSRAARRIERHLGQWDMADERIGHEMMQASSEEKIALQSYRLDLLAAIGEHALAQECCQEVLAITPNDIGTLLHTLSLSLDGSDDAKIQASEALADTLGDLGLSRAAHALSGCLLQFREPECQTGELSARDHFFRAAQSKDGFDLGLMLSVVAAEEWGATGATAERSVYDLLSAKEGPEAWSPPDSIGGALYLLQGVSLAGEGAFDKSRHAFVLAEECQAGSQTPLSFSLAFTKAFMLGSEGEAWLHLASTLQNPQWQSQAYFRASQMVERELALPSLASALDLSPDSEFIATELRRAEIASGNSTFVHAQDKHQIMDGASPVRVFRLLESSANLPVDSELDATVTQSISTGESGVVMRALAMHFAYASNDVRRVSEYHRVCEANASSAAEEASHTRGACRWESRLALQSMDTESLLDAANGWQAMSEAHGSEAPQGTGAILMATYLASLAQSAERVADYGSSLPGPFSDVDLGMFYVLNAHPDSPPSSDDIQALLNADSESQIRVAEFRWSTLLVGGDWSGAAQVMEGLGADKGADNGAKELRCRSLYRSAFVRERYDTDLVLAQESLLSLREVHPEFCDLLQTSRRSSRASRSPYEQSNNALSPQVPVCDLSTEIRQADDLWQEGEGQAACGILEGLAARFPDDALVQYELEQMCWQAKASAMLSSNYLGSLRAAEAIGDMAAKAELCDKLARVDLELHDDPESAFMFWESAANAQPTRLDYQRILEREYSELSRVQKMRESLVLVLGRIAAQTPVGKERSHYLRQQAFWAEREDRSSEAAVEAYKSTLENDHSCRAALFYLESHYRNESASEDLAIVEAQVAVYFEKDPKAHATFLVRSGEAWLEIGKPTRALDLFQAACAGVAGFRSSLFAWREMALDRKMWASLAAVSLEEAKTTANDDKRRDLCHLAGVVLMDKDDNPDEAKSAFRQVLAIDSQHRDAFVRLRRLLEDDDQYAELVALFEARVTTTEETETPEKRKDKVICELHHLLAKLRSGPLEDDEAALDDYRAILRRRRNDREAIVGVSTITQRLEKWSEAASAIMLQVRLETDSSVLKDLYHKLGTIYTEHTPDVTWALRSYERVIAIDSADAVALRAISLLGIESGDFQVALGACEKLMAQNPGVDEKIETLHRMAHIFVEGFGNDQQAERALRSALDVDPSSDLARSTIVSFFVARKDERSARIHIDTSIRAMHNRLQIDAQDLVAYRSLARAFNARTKCGSPECKTAATAAASIAVLLGDSSGDIVKLAQRTPSPAAKGLASPQHDELFWSAAGQASLRSLFLPLGDKLAKLMGPDLKGLGVGRSDRQRKGADASVALVAELCTAMGTETADLYVSRNKSAAFGIVPNRPIALILGKELISIKRPDELRFWVGRAMAFARAGFLTPLHLGEEDFGVLLVALLRHFIHDFMPEGVNEKLVGPVQHKTRKLLSANLVQTLTPYGLGLATSDFDHKTIWMGLKASANRAGLLCMGSISGAVAALMRLKSIDSIPEALQDPEIAELVRFSVSTEYGRYWLEVTSSEASSQ